MSDEQGGVTLEYLKGHLKMDYFSFRAKRVFVQKKRPKAYHGSIFFLFFKKILMGVQDLQYCGDYKMQA